MNIKMAAALAVLLLGCTIGPSAIASNPIDSAGVRHNQMLSCLEEKDPPDDELLIAVVKECGYDPGMPLDTFVKTYLPVFGIPPGTATVTVMEPFRERYSEYEFSFFTRLDEIFFTSTSIDEVKERLATLESEATERLDPESDTGRTILGGISVARHSANHWAEYAEPGTDSSKARIPRILKIIVVILADMIAYLATDSSEVAGAVSKYVKGLVEKL